METRVVSPTASRGLLIVIALTLLFRLPFLNQAVQGDDDVYLTEAAHAQLEPLHPADVTYVFRGDTVDLRGQTHPPLNAWPLAVLVALFGGVREVPFHAAYLVFSLIAVWSMWRLALRFSPHPVWATLLFSVVPAFFINANSFEPDVPFLAFWVASIALFIEQRYALAVLAMVFASLEAYQAIFLIPILWAWCFLAKRPRKAALFALTPAVVLLAAQFFERLSTGALPATVLSGYFTHYAFQALGAKLRSALALAIHFCFIVSPILIPGAALAAWRSRRDRDTRFLMAWIIIFFAGAVVIFFAGAARYLLPIAAPVALLASRLRPRWLALGFALQLALSFLLAIENYDHWADYRDLTPTIARLANGKRVWADGEWGFRYYLEQAGALPLTKAQKLRPSDLVVSSALAHAVPLTDPASPVLQVNIESAVPLRILGLGVHSGFSDSSAGLWPFGVSSNPIDRVTAYVIGERHITRDFLTLDAPDAREQIVSGVYDDHWTGPAATIILKSPPEARNLRANFYLSNAAPPREVTLKVDGREVARATYSAPGVYKLESQPIPLSGPTTTVEIDVTPTFRAPGDARDLGAVLTSIGFAPAP